MDVKGFCMCVCACVRVFYPCLVSLFCKSLYFQSIFYLTVQHFCERPIRKILNVNVKSSDMIFRRTKTNPMYYCTDVINVIATMDFPSVY